MIKKIVKKYYNGGTGLENFIQKLFKDFFN